MDLPVIDSQYLLDFLGGPYHFGLNQWMRRLAEDCAIPYKTDVYPFYGSDGEAFWRAGGNVALALIGPGVDASHNYERTHLEMLLATTRWLVAYLLDPGPINRH
jgi:putative aminopeptidase FrvX